MKEEKREELPHRELNPGRPRDRRVLPNVEGLCAGGLCAVVIPFSLD